MQASSIGVVGLGASLLAAAFTDWSFISLLFLVGFLITQYQLSLPGRNRKCIFSLLALLVLSVGTFLLGVTFVLVWVLLGTHWNISNARVLQIIGFSRLNPSPQGIGDILLFFVPKIAVTVFSSITLYQKSSSSDDVDRVRPGTFAFDIRAAMRSFALPTVQVLAGSVFPCWVALPYYICSCTGLFHWAVTNNFVGLSWGWWPLLLYNGTHIFALYVRQVPLPLPGWIFELADYVGLFSDSSPATGWVKGLQAFSLMALYFLLCFAIGLDEHEYERFRNFLPEDVGDEDELREHLLPPSEMRRTRSRNLEQRRMLAFKEAAVCFFACGFPICLVALVCWSFKFASFCALILLVYVGFILYVFPSLFLLRRLNGVLLGFILLWGLCTYIFNAGFTIMNSRFELNAAIWQSIGLWKYSSPGLFIMAQFALGVLVATDLFAGNSILANSNEPEENDESVIDEQQNGWLLVVAVTAWCIHRSAHVISLVLIFIVGLRSGLIHAFYMAFFILYLLSPQAARNTRHFLMLYCEVHIGLLYVLHLDWISAILETHKESVQPILSQLGIWNKATTHDYLAVAALLCFSAIQSHGIKVICSLAAAAQQSARYNPFVSSVYGSHNSELLPAYHENWITIYLAYVGEQFRASYRSFGTYVVYATVLAAVYVAEPNYVTFGYLILLLIWIVGRQVIGKTESLLWVPLFVYTCFIFVSKYLLSVFPDLQEYLAEYIDLKEDLGFDPQASLLWHLWDALAILAVLQLYRYERRQPSLPEIEPASSLSTNLTDILDFARRFLILHSGKILSVAVFYAAVSPVGALGFVYLLLLICTCNVRKTSVAPARIYATYSSVILALEYLYQMFGDETGTDPDQVHGKFVYWLGLRRYNHGPWGIEQGTLSKTLVLAACMLQYCSFQWLQKLPNSWRRSEEPCCLFVLGRRDDGPTDPLLVRGQRRYETISESDSLQRDGGACNSPVSPALSRETSRESKKWSRRAMILKQEKYEAQWQALTSWGKHLLEHFFTFYGIEVNMLVLLVASFAVLNIFSLVYLTALALCVLLSRRYILALWPYFVALFSCILVVEYATLAKLPPTWNATPPGNVAEMHCHDCWKTSGKNLGFCWTCWLGVVDDRQVLVAYFLVFITSSLQLGASKFADTPSFHSARLAISRRLAWSEISYETTEQWTWLDYMRFAFYRHLLHVVLLLVFVTGTLQYDLLHLGYLAFSMVFFRMRDTIMKQRNTIFGTLRFYNFGLIVASLIFQAPFFKFLDGRGCTPFSIFGLYKYDYGFRITARSALVDITIFCLAGLQARIFRTREFEQVLRYLAAEQLEARAYAQESKAAWKKEQLQRIREMEDRKIHRRMQVEKMKMDMIPMQMHMDVLNTAGKFKPDYSPFKLGLGHSPGLSPAGVRRRLINSVSDSELTEHEHEHEHTPSTGLRRRRRRRLDMGADGFEAEAMIKHLGLESPDKDRQAEPDPEHESETSLGVRRVSKPGLNLLGDVHNLGNKALANLVGLLNLESDESSSAEDEAKVEDDFQEEMAADDAAPKAASPSETRRRLSMICSYFWSKLLANTDIVCYVLFVLVYVWNFSVLTLVFPASLFLYALLVNPGPAQHFWSLMLIYTEFSILVQYMYQIIVNHCGHDDIPLWLKKLGVSGRNMDRSFVASVMPLFLVYLATLVQSSIRARDGEWMFVTEDGAVFSSRRPSEGNFDIEAARVASRRRFWGFCDKISGAFFGTLRTLVTCWRSLTDGSEVPPHFVQVTLSVPNWPEDGIQPAKIEAAFNKLLQDVREGDQCSRVRVESLEPARESEYTALAVLEVIRVAPRTNSLMDRLLTSLTPASDVAAEILKAKDMEDELEFPYPIISVIAGGKKQVDLYAYIFGTDLLAFLYVALFYQSFIKNSPEFLDVYQLEDQFPKEFVFVLMTLFFLIVLDRVLYLSAFAIGKVFYYFVTLVLYTSYITSFVWGMELQHSGSAFFQLLPLRGFYLLKALSLALQASQLRFGIPRKSTLYGQFLTRKVSSLSWLGFCIYRALPFLFELRCVLDWSCTTTALSMYDWLKLEDIYASLFLVQCDIKLAREKHRLGEKRSMWIKFCNGLCLFFVLICVIWAPMLIYSSGNPTNFVNDILEAQAHIDVRTSGGSFSLYDSQLCKIHSMLDVATKGKGNSVDPTGSLDSFDAKDVQIVCCEADASTLWLISPPTLRSLIRSVDDKVELAASWSFHRERPKNKEIVTFMGQPLEVGSLRGIINGTYNSVTVNDLYPRYFRITSSGEVRTLESNDATVSGTLTLNQEYQSWWSFARTNATKDEVCGGVSGPLAIAVSEEVPKGLIGDTLSKFNIWSLYITFVLAVGRFIRLQCADLRMRIPYENFSSCERLIAICEDIYAARAEGELELEEGLFWTLVKIYRSPHVLIEYTKSE